MRIHLLSFPLIAAVLIGCSPKKPESKPSPGTMPPVAVKQGVTFATDIKPLFDKSCVNCHGPKKQKSGLRLDSLEASVHGSDDGPVFEVGKSEFSLMISNVARLGIEDDWMPPIDDKHSPLTQDEAALIRAWIDQGAK
jgi:hypothetical protein